MKNNYESRTHRARCPTNDEWGNPHSSFVLRYLVILVCAMVFVSSARAQVGHIVTVRPDRAAPGMNVVVELLTRYDAPRPFGYDALDSLVSIAAIHPADTSRIVIGPPIVSWNGRLLQIPIFIVPNASLGIIPIAIFSALTGTLDTVNFTIDAPQHLGPITHDVTISDGFGELSASNTILVDSLIVTNAKVHFSLTKPDTLPGNPRLLPVVILSKGPVRLTNASIVVDADSLDGGSGGGGGGHGFQGAGGAGFTGGGSSSDTAMTNAGSDTSATLNAGGRCATGVPGGGSEEGDQGGGGGTGAPYGLSGSSGIGNISSPIGGFGGGSGAGEQPNPFKEYGGGGGGFGTSGAGGFDPNGQGLNGGADNGGRFLVPLAGGSGGGAGNSVDLGDGALGASGGGGGGAIELISYDSIVAISSTFSARGDSGKSGIVIAAGGGGGSGGAVYVASPKGIQAIGTSINVAGGIGGRPSADSVGFFGGTGGFGRVRIDGPSNLTSVPGLAPASVWSHGISLTPLLPPQPKNGFVRLMGFAQDTINTLDTVRIFYKTQHAAWQSVDTVRAANGSWAKWLPLSHDSAMYVVAYIEVNGPVSDPANYTYEPSWLVSNASMGVIAHPASPFLVVSDTLDFGTVRTGRCKTLPLIIHNEGEAPLMVGKGVLSGSPEFSLLIDTPLDIAPYSADTVQIQFCANASGKDSALLTYTSNDSTNSTKIITLHGAGLMRHDSLVVSPTVLHFGHVPVGECQSDTVSLLSAGSDTLYLARSIWNAPPFSSKLIPADTALSPNKKSSLIITFCPTDSGVVHQSQVLDERQDSIVMDGTGVVRRAASLGTKNIGTYCIHHTIAFVDTISNLGSDTETLVSFRNSSPPQSVQIGEILSSEQHIAVPVSWVPNAVGSFMDTILYRLSDTTLTTTVQYRVRGAELRFDSTLAFHFVCAGESDTVTASIRNVGADTVAMTGFDLEVGAPLIIPLDTVGPLLPDSIVNLRFVFTPTDTIQQFDTLHITLNDGVCDSLIAIVLSGRGIDSGLAAEAIDFDSVAVGVCREDSMFVENPCGPPVTIDSVAFVHSAFQLVDSTPLLIPSPGSLEVVFRFCPLDSGMEADTAIFYPHVGQPFKAVLRGIGVSQPASADRAYFTVSSLSARSDSTVTTIVTLDSSSLKGTHPVRAVIGYDPSVVYFLGGSPVPAQAVGSDSIQFSPTIDFDSTGFIESISWLTLLGPRPSSVIGLAMTTDKPVDVRVKNGTITVTDCTGLNGQFSVGGAYTLGPVTPNPASDIVGFNLTLGNDGYVESGLYDMTGRLVEPLLAKSFIRGSYAITISTESLASGRYMVVVRSLGWCAEKPLIIDR